jgi:deazaflavin-dependent oxidoreductase (nitroreductase family)
LCQEEPVADANDWNSRIIADFRANGGKVGGQFEGAPLVLVHHKGKRTGQEYIAPVMYLPGDDDRIYIFATKGGAPTHPDWYYNLVAVPETTVEVGTETYPVKITDVTGPQRDQMYAEQARRYPGFAEYEQKTKGVRVIPVLALDRVS